MRQTPLPPLGIYLHFPWCEKKCPYCDFNSHETRVLPEEAYIDALLADLENDLHHVSGRPIETLFIGGGTPSLMSVAGLSRLLGAVAQRLEFSPQLEATMEANPGSAEAEKFAGFRDAGINRLSIGVQSFQDSQLQQLGRVHNSDQAHSAIEAAKSAGYSNFNLDLMHGLPGQTAQLAQSDLKAALSHRPPHLSWYQLTVEPNTQFHSSPPQLPQEDTLAAITRDGEQQLAAAGLVNYEVSAYRTLPESACRHNLNYWRFGDYLGIGAGAHGKITTTDGLVTRYAKRRQPTGYLAAPDNAYIATSRTLTEAELVGEFVLNALRLREGFTLENFTARTGLGPDHLQPELDNMVERGLLEVTRDRVKTTDLGARFLDTVVAAFF